MNNIASFFSKIVKKVKEESELKEYIVFILNNKTKGNISNDDITITNTVLKIKNHPLIIQELILQKESILKEISNKFPKKITDLR